MSQTTTQKQFSKVRLKDQFFNRKNKMFYQFSFVGEAVVVNCSLLVVALLLDYWHVVAVAVVAAAVVVGLVDPCSL